MKNNNLIRSVFILFIILAFSISGGTMNSVYDFTMTDINGKKVSLSSYKDKVILIVNVASKCGFTSQYKGLQKLHKEYMDKGLAILGFPANNFMNQEPGTDQDIKSFCTLNYGVTFDMFSKISVKGKDIDPLYEFLTDKKSNPKFNGEITWNFNKFLIDRKGQIINRFDTRTKPFSKKMIKAIEEALDPK